MPVVEQSYFPHTVWRAILSPASEGWKRRALMCPEPLSKCQPSTCRLSSAQGSTGACTAPLSSGLRGWCCTQLSQSTWEASALAPPAYQTSGNTQFLTPGTKVNSPEAVNSSKHFLQPSEPTNIAGSTGGPGWEQSEWLCSWQSPPVRGWFTTPQPYMGESLRQERQVWEPFSKVCG